MSLKFIIIFLLLTSPCFRLFKRIVKRILPIEAVNKVGDFGTKINLKITKTEIWFDCLVVIQLLIIIAMVYSPFIYLQYLVAKWIVNLP